MTNKFLLVNDSCVCRTELTKPPTITLMLIPKSVVVAGIVLIAFLVVFFPYGPYLTFVTPLISWLNLDLGIEICFFD